MLWGCFAASGTGIFHKVDRIMRREYLQILILYFGSTTKLEGSWVFQEDNEPKHPNRTGFEMDEAG